MSSASSTELQARRRNSTMRQINTQILGLPATALSLTQEIQSGQMSSVWKVQEDDINLEVRVGRDSAWVFIEQTDGPRLALRTAYSFGGEIKVKLLSGKRGFEAKTPIGVYTVEISLKGQGTGLVRCTQKLAPVEDLLVAQWPRDLFPLGPDETPASAQGKVRAAQRGLSAAVVFATTDDASPGSFLYFQNLTALNPYFHATDTLPDGRVGGVWPELGYEIPGNALKHLPADKEIVLSDAVICLSKGADLNPRTQAASFLRMLALIYVAIEKPETKFRDWPQKAKETLRDLEKAPEVTIEHYGNLYVRPYVDAEYPDCMCQVALAAPIAEYAEWIGKPAPMAATLMKGLPKFYDSKLKSLRRYLPNVGKDKDKDEVDSWYLYHPLSNLARLAQGGNKQAENLFFNTLEFSIKAAQHFNYDWPIQYNLKTLDIIKRRSEPGKPGQSDVGGFYAYLMIQAWELNNDQRYLEEAERAIKATSTYEFEITYQANLVAFGVAACLRLYGITKRKFFYDQAKVFLASFMHNCCLWESEAEHAKHYSVWLASACLHDASYMAMFECADSFVAFSEILADTDVELDWETRLMLSEYCRHTLSAAWYFYPSELPESAIATEIRNGYIDRKLAFPLEDLYPSGQQAGSVGQEVYGGGAAFLYSTRTTHMPEGAPFAIFCECPLREMETQESVTELTLGGTSEILSRVRIVGNAGKRLPNLEIRFKDGPSIEAKRTQESHREFFVPSDSTIVISW